MEQFINDRANVFFRLYPYKNNIENYVNQFDYFLIANDIIIQRYNKINEINSLLKNVRVFEKFMSYSDNALHLNNITINNIINNNYIELFIYPDINPPTKQDFIKFAVALYNKNIKLKFFNNVTNKEKIKFLSDSNEDIEVLYNNIITIMRD